MLQCEVCRRAFMSRRYLSQHCCRTRDKTTVSCRKCGKEFLSVGTLQLHWRWKHRRGRTRLKSPPVRGTKYTPWPVSALKFKFSKSCSNGSIHSVYGEHLRSNGVSDETGTSSFSSPVSESEIASLPENRMKSPPFGGVDGRFGEENSDLEGLNMSMDEMECDQAQEKLVVDSCVQRVDEKPASCSNSPAVNLSDNADSSAEKAYNSTEDMAMSESGDSNASPERDFSGSVDDISQSESRVEEEKENNLGKSGEETVQSVLQIGDVSTDLHNGSISSRQESEETAEKVTDLASQKWPGIPDNDNVLRLNNNNYMDTSGCEMEDVDGGCENEVCGSVRANKNSCPSEKSSVHIESENTGKTENGIIESGSDTDCETMDVSDDKTLTFINEGSAEPGAIISRKSPAAEKVHSPEALEGESRAASTTIDSNQTEATENRKSNIAEERSQAANLDDCSQEAAMEDAALESPAGEKSLFKHIVESQEAPNMAAVNQECLMADETLDPILVDNDGQEMSAKEAALEPINKQNSSFTRFLESVKAPILDDGGQEALATEAGLGPMERELILVDTQGIESVPDSLKDMMAADDLVEVEIVQCSDGAIVVQQVSSTGDDEAESEYIDVEDAPFQHSDWPGGETDNLQNPQLMTFYEGSDGLQNSQTVSPESRKESSKSERHWLDGFLIPGGEALLSHWQDESESNTNNDSADISADKKSVDCSHSHLESETKSPESDQLKITHELGVQLPLSVELEAQQKKQVNDPSHSHYCPCNVHNIPVKRIKSLTKQHHTLLNLRHKIYKLFRILFPNLSYPHRFNKDTHAVERLMDEVLVTVNDKTFPSYLQQLETTIYTDQPQVLLCRSPQACLAQLRCKLWHLLNSLIPQLSQTKLPQEQVEKLLDLVISVNTKKKKVPTATLR